MHLILKHLAENKKALFLSLALAAVNQGFSLLDPQIFRLIVDKYAIHALEIPRAEFMRGTLILIAASVGVAFVSRVAKNFQDYFVNVATQRVGARLYAEGIAHSFSLPYAAFEDQRSGELLQKLQKARGDIERAIMGAINTIFLSLIGILFVLIYAFFVHWAIGAVYVLMIPILGVVMFSLSRRIKVAQERITRQIADFAGSTTETIRNVELVKSLGLEEQEVVRLKEVNESILALELEKVRTIRKISFVQGTIVNALRSALLFLMLWLVFTGGITLGQLFALLFYSFAIFTPLSEVGNVAAQFQEAKGSAASLQGIFTTAPEEKPEYPVAPGIFDSIRFDQVWFRYQNASMDSLSSADFEIKKGEKIAFVGPSGSGKTTIIKLIVGLYRPTKGRILVNGTDSKSIDFDAFRKRVGFVAQETQLFSGTIRDNLLFAQPNATDRECEAALRSAAAQSILERSPEGLDTKIGEAGIKVSGGERQRLAIARALLRRPELIVFDEATSSLDSITEKEITKTIREIERSHPGTAVILVAHRLSTVMHAKRIFVLEKGRIVEIGSHAELLKKKGLYAALWREQVGL